MFFSKLRRGALTLGIIPKVMDSISKSSLPESVKGVLCHPAGPLTIHFWAPTLKWGISIAQLMDINRPIENVSEAQQIAVTATGLIWSRYSMVIIPKNWNLFSVNVFMAITGLYQLYRIAMFKLYNEKVALKF